MERTSNNKRSAGEQQAGDDKRQKVRGALSPPPVIRRPRVGVALHGPEDLLMFEDLVKDWGKKPPQTRIGAECMLSVLSDAAQLRYESGRTQAALTLLLDCHAQSLHWLGPSAQRTVYLLALLTIYLYEMGSPSHAMGFGQLMVNEMRGQDIDLALSPGDVVRAAHRTSLALFFSDQMDEGLDTAALAEGWAARVLPAGRESLHISLDRAIMVHKTGGDATELLERCLSRCQEPSDRSNALGWLAMAHAKKENGEEALRAASEFVRALGDAPSPERELQGDTLLVVAHLAASHAQEALALADKWLARLEEDTNSLRLFQAARAAALLWRGEPSEAMALVQQVLPGGLPEAHPPAASGRMAEVPWDLAEAVEGMLKLHEG